MDYKQMMGLGATIGSGVGQGMMTGRFKQAFNAGQGAVGDLYQAKRFGEEFMGPDMSGFENKLLDLRRQSAPARRGVASGGPFGSPDLMNR